MCIQFQHDTSSPRLAGPDKIIPTSKSFFINNCFHTAYCVRNAVCRSVAHCLHISRQGRDTPGCDLILICFVTKTSKHVMQGQKKFSNPSIESALTVVLVWVLHSGALPAGLRRSERSGAAPWWRWSTERPADGRISAGTRCCILGDPDHGTGRLSTDPFSVKPQKNRDEILPALLVISFYLISGNSRHNREQTSSSVNIPEVFCRMAYIQCATVTACFQLW